jgi:hypothetical protein
MFSTNAPECLLYSQTKIRVDDSNQGIGVVLWLSFNMDEGHSPPTRNVDKSPSTSHRNHKLHYKYLTPTKVQAKNHIPISPQEDHHGPQYVYGASYANSHWSEIATI